MSRRVVVGLGILSLVVVTVLLVAIGQTTVDHEPSPSPSSSGLARVPADQQAMAVAIRDSSGDIADALVIAARSTGGSATGSGLYVPPSLGVQFTDSGTVTLTDLGSDAPQAIQDRLAGQLGVAIPNGLVLDRLAFAALVDAGGGVIVDVKKPIYVRKVGGKRVLLVAAGQQRLAGPLAADYAAFLGPGEEESARSARFAQVWPATIAGLPSGESHMRNVIGSLGALARNSTSVGVVARILMEYQAAQKAGSLMIGALPGSTTGRGGGAIFTPDSVATDALSAQLFPAIKTIGGIDGVPERIRLVGVGADSVQLVEAGRRLARTGAEVVYGGYAATEAVSVVYVPRKGDGLVPGQRVASDMGLGEAIVRVDLSRAAGVNASLWAAQDLFPRSPPPTSIASAPGSSATGAR